MKTLTVHASSTYDIHIGEGILPAALERVAGRGRFCVVTDSNVEPLYGETVRGLLAAHGRVSGFTFPAGETSKTLGTFSLLLEHLAGAGLTRSDTVVALGGGVTGDLAGFAAGCYLRGVRVIQIPTTLLAMIDSSVGGKTGVDLTAGKNLAGVFWQPAAVVADTALLSTLEPSVLADGMAEAVKYGMIADDALFASIERGEPVTADMIFACVDCKRRLVEADERDTGARQLLNFGHSFGHAIEKASGYAVGHGAAVAAGMVVACRLSETLGLYSAETTARLRAVLRACGLPDEPPYPPASLVDTLLLDKKRSGDGITFVFCERPGRCLLRRMPFDELRALTARTFGA